MSSNVAFLTHCSDISRCLSMDGSSHSRSFSITEYVSEALYLSHSDFTRSSVLVWIDSERLSTLAISTVLITNAWFKGGLNFLTIW